MPLLLPLRMASPRSLYGGQLLDTASGWEALVSAACGNLAMGLRGWGEGGWNVGLKGQRVEAWRKAAALGLAQAQIRTR